MTLKMYVVHGCLAIPCMCDTTVTQFTGVGSMDAPGAGAPVKFLSGIHTKSYFALKCFLYYQLV